MNKKFINLGKIALLLTFVIAQFFVVQNSYAVSLEKALEAYDFEEYENAFIWLKPWAKEGDADAQYRLGLLYENGYGVDVNTKLALKWYRASAKQGQRKAKRRLQNLRKSATAASGNESVATQWYEDLAVSGDSEAQYYLGFIYETGWSVPVDNIEATRWYEKSAAKGVKEAQFRLGMMFLTGSGGNKSEIQGERWIRQAAKNNHKLAAVIRDKLFDAKDLVKVNIKFDKIYETIRKQSAKNHKKAIASIKNVVQVAKSKVNKEKSKKKKRLAKIQQIESAIDQEVFSEEALLGPGGRKTYRWYQFKAEAGDAASQYELGQLYEVGIEVKRNLITAAEWYRLAADQGFTKAQYYVGMWYANGIVVTQNETLASSYLSAAANKGYDKANKFLERTQAGRLVDNTESIAVWWLKQQAANGSAGAKYRLAYLYEQGRGIKKNTLTAGKLYKLAAKQGYAAALIKDSKLGTMVKTPEIMPAKIDDPMDKDHDEDEKSILWYLTVSLVLLAPIFGFITVLRRDKKNAF